MNNLFANSRRVLAMSGIHPDETLTIYGTTASVDGTTQRQTRVQTTVLATVLGNVQPASSYFELIPDEFKADATDIAFCDANTNWLAGVIVSDPAGHRYQALHIADWTSYVAVTLRQLTGVSG